MGAAMAGRLLAAGVDVRIYNRTAARATPLIAHGARLFDTPRAACHSVEAIVSMVSDDSASREVWLGASGALSVTPCASTALTRTCMAALSGICSCR